MLLRKDSSRPFAPLLLYCAFGVLGVLAIVLRVSLYHVETSDYTAFVSQWYDYIQTHGGFAALKDNFSNYNPPYLYLLAIATYLPVPKLIAIKSISVLFDGVLGFFVYLLVSLKYRRSYAAIIAVLVFLFAPTIFINSAAWGQCDAIYTAFCVGSLYFLLKERPVWACVFFAVALAFKLQAIFFAPVLFVLLLRKRLPLKYLVFIPLVYLLLMAPTLIAGRDVASLLSVYANQVNSGGGTILSTGNGAGRGQFNGVGRGQFFGNGNGNGGNAGPGGFLGGNGGDGGTGQFGGNGAYRGQFRGGRGVSRDFTSSLTLNAPSFYQWLPANAPMYWKWLGIVLAGLLIVVVGLLFMMSKQKITAAIMLKAALAFAIAIPFLLPEMHERYFYLADVLSIIYAFYFPRYFYIAIIMQASSLLSYGPYFFNREFIGLGYVAFAVLVIAAITLTDLVLTLYPRSGKDVTVPDGAGDEAAPKTSDDEVVYAQSSVEHATGEA